MKCLLALLCLVVAAYAAPKLHQNLQSYPKVLPTVGEIFGPVVTATSVSDTGRLRKDGNVFRWCVDADDHLEDLVLADQVFETVKEMETYMKNSLTNETVVIKIDPYALNGKYLEVLWSKAITPNALKMICHYPGNNPPFCHLILNSGHIIKQTYSMVRLLDENTVFPVVFLSHMACTTGSSCYWVSHPTEIAVVDKSII